MIMKASDQRLLIVDDTQENLQILGAILKQKGYLINVAMDGQQAVDAAHKINPDLILMDIMMPVMDGFQACQLLKADERTRDIPVIFLTARAETSDIANGFNLGAVDYIVKPFNATELLQRVRTHLNIRALQTSLSRRVDELADALATISSMARENESLLRHELANAMHLIQGYVDLLELEMESEPESRRALVSRLKGGMGALTGLLDALRDLQAIEYGRTPLQKTSLDLRLLLEEEVRSQEVSAGGSIRIAFRSGSQDSRLEADARFLPGVFRNLIKNAIEHVQGLDPKDHHLGVVLGDVDDGLGVVVSNGGAPLSEEQAEHFFDKFNSTKKASGGTGLGTSYAATVVKAHGGKISVQSNETDGTRVRVWLPRRSPDGLGGLYSAVRTK